jgi:hypothetical protein
MRARPAPYAPAIRGGVTRRLVVQRRVNHKVSREAALRSRYLWRRSRSRVGWTNPREAAVCFKDGGSRIAEYRPTMREVKISLTGWKLADAMGELRKWLDHHNCVPVNFDIERGKRRVLVVRVLFADDAMADAFERDFGGR